MQYMLMVILVRPFKIFVLGNIVNIFQEINLSIVLSLNLYLFSSNLSSDDTKQICNVIVMVTLVAIMLNILFFYIANIVNIIIFLKNRKKSRQIRSE